MWKGGGKNQRVVLFLKHNWLAWIARRTREKILNFLESKSVLSVSNFLILRSLGTQMEDPQLLCESP
jgi:hypothetical protein